MSTFREQWIDDGFPWCDECGNPAVFSEFHGTLHATQEHRFGVPKRLDPAGHVVTMRIWAEVGRRGRAES